MTIRRPRVLLAMAPAAFGVQFRADELKRLASIADVDEPVHVTELDSSATRRRLAEVDVLITSWGVPRLTEERLLAAPRLDAVLHSAGSVRGFVGEEVWRRGIVVSSSAEENAIPVAEYTLAAVIMAGKKAPFLAAKAHQTHDGWHDVVGRDDLSNRGRTIGLVGFSRIGRRVAAMLRMLETAAVLVADPFASAEEVAASGAELVSLDELLRRSEILSLHAPLLPNTRHMIGARELSLLPEGATVINTARGGLINHDALIAECASGRLDAVLDVTEPEPLPVDSVLYDLPNVMITPHVAGSLGSETRRMSNHAIDELERWIAGDKLLTPVTPDSFAAGA